MKKGMILLANGFEDTEAITTIDILKRAGLVIDTIGFKNKTITTQSNLSINCDYLLNQIDLSSYDFLVIPGGKAVFNELTSEENFMDVKEVVQSFYSNNKLIACICAAPMILDKLGILNNKKFTCFPGCIENSLGLNTNAPVEVSDNIITGKAMGYTFDFALLIVSKLLGNKVKEDVSKKIIGE